jgi:RND family efflux transporter MFP subunit
MKKYNLLPMLLFIAIVLVTGCQQEGEIDKATDEAYTPVRVLSVETGTIREEAVFTGQIQPIKEVSIMGKYSGEIAQTYFTVGNNVSKGDVLFTFNERDMRHNVEALESQVNSAQAAVNSANLNVNMASGSQEQNQRIQMESSLNSAKITYDNAKKNYENTKALYEDSIVSKIEFDGVEQAYQQAKNAYETLEESYSLLTDKQIPESLSLAKNQLQQAYASKDALAIQYNNAKETLADLNVISPIDGTIATKNIETGEIYNSSFPAYTVIDMDTVFVTIHVTDQWSNSIHLDNQVSVSIKALSDKEYRGSVYEISPVPNQANFTYPVKIKIDNSDHQIKPGMFAEVSVIKNEAKDVLVVNRNDLELSQGNWFAYVVKDGIVQVIPVQLGLDNGKEVEVSGGLEPGQLLIVSGREYVDHQEKVTIIE